jgi:tail lysozyme/minor tail protein
VPARTVTITGLGDFRQLQAELERTGVISAQSTRSITEGAATAGEAAAKQAEAMGASADEQEAAAARAASAYVDGAEKMTQAQKAAAAAAAAVAEANGASADEIVAASARAVEAQKALQDASVDTAAVADASGARIGTAFDEGTAKAGSALTRLGETGASWGIPLSGSLTKMGKEFDEADSKAGKFGSALASGGKLAVTAGLAGFGVAAVEGVKGASALQKQMTMLETQAGASSKQVKTLTSSILGMAGEVGTKPQELAEGMYHVVSALNATTAPAQRVSTEYGVMKAAAEGAQIGGANIVDVTNALDAAVISGLPGLGSYSHAMGDLNTIVGAGDMTMQQLADALGTGLLAPMKNFGVSLQDIGGALAVFGDNNLRGAAAATKLTSAIRIMAAPSKTAAGYLGEVGISATELGDDIRSHGLADALEDLKKHLQDSGDTATQQMRVLSNAFGGRQAMGVQILLAQLDRLKDKVKDVSQGGSNFGPDWQKRTENLSFAMDKLKASVDADADRLGFFLIPKLQATGKALGNVIVWFEKNKTAADALGIVVGGVLGTAVAAFAYQKAVAFYGSVVRMGEGMIKLASTVESSVANIVAKFTAQDTAAATSAEAQTASARDVEASLYGEGAAAERTAAEMQTSFGEIDSGFATMVTAAETAEGQMAMTFAEIGTGAETMAGTVTAADGELETANVAVGASFTKMLGPIALATAALYGVVKAEEAVIGGHIGELLGGGQPGEKSKEGEAYGGLKSKPSGSVQGVYGSLQQLGLTTTEASGITAVLGGESGLRPTATGSEGAFGLAQWLGSRLSGLAQFASGKHESDSSVKAQLEYLVKELHGPEAGTLSKLGEAKTPQQAAQVFTEDFERPAKQNIPAVLKRAQSYYPHALAGGVAGAPEAPASSGSSETFKSGPGTKEPPSAAQEKAAEKQEKAAEKAGEKLEKAAEKAKEKLEEGAKKAAEELKHHLEKTTEKGEALAKKYEAEIQNSTPAAMEKALGISTSAQGLATVHEGIPGSIAQKTTRPSAIGGLVETVRTGGASMASLVAALGKSASGSVAGKQEATLVSALNATHQKKLEELASKLVALHEHALSSLAVEMVATETMKLGESLKIQATEEKDRTTQAEHTATDQLNIVKAEQAQQTDAMKAAATAIGDATQSMSDSFAALAQSIEAQSKVMADSSNAVVTGIKDQTNIEVAILGERGLYGLNLIAQKEEVQLDQMKASYDQQIQQAKIAEDQLAAQWQGVLAQDQQLVDEDKTQADVQEAAAQAHADAVAIKAAGEIAAAQEQVDTVQLAQDQKIGNAELKVLAAANKSKEQQSLAASGLSFAEHEAEHQETAAAGHLKTVETEANKMAEQATQAMENVTNTWNQAIKNAELAMAQAKGESAVALAKAAQSLQAIEDTAAKEEAKLEKEVDVTKERSQVQYAGSGLVVNQYGMNPEDAAANASELGWVLRQLMPLP